MPLNAYALVLLFAVASILVGWAAVRAVGRIGGPRTRLAILLPVAAAFGALYAIGHRLGLAVGPEIPMFGFRVALVGDLAIGFAAALTAALAQAVVLLRVQPRRRSSGGTSPGSSPVATGIPLRDQSLYDPE